MQLYAGLPTITNKITVQEQQGIPHHLLGCIGLHEQTWVVGTFVKKVLGVIEEIRSRGRLPILVGGTHYYTQSLLFKDRLAEENGQEEKRTFVEDTKDEWPILGQPTDVLLEELKRVDPIMADRWHPNDHRKIQRSLEIYLQTGRKASDIYMEQRRAQNDPKNLSEEVAILDGPYMRFPTLLFWIHADAETLRDRLNKRVDKMLKSGLPGEVWTLNAIARAQHKAGKPVDETRGIWVSIGFKEFKSYVDAHERGDTGKHDLPKLKAEALEKTKIATRQYAKRQLRWIRIKLVNALSQANTSEYLYLLDGTNVSSFDHDVVAPALQLTYDFITSTNPLPSPGSMSKVAAEMLTPRRDYDLATKPEEWTRQYCEHCVVTCVTKEQWEIHIKSKAHRKRICPKKSADKKMKPRRSGSANDVGGGIDEAVILSEVARDDLDDGFW